MWKPSPALVAAAIALLVTIPAVYALLRAHDVFFEQEANPATIIWSAHVAMFWRLAIGTYIGGMAAPFAFMAAKRNLARTMRVLYSLTLAVAILIAVQGLFLP